LELDFNKEKELDDPRRWCGVEDFRPARKIELEPRHLRLIAVNLDKELRQLLENKIVSASISGSEVVVRGKLITRPAKPVFKTTGKLATGCKLIEPIRRADQHSVLLTASDKVFEKISPNANEPIPVETEEIDLSKKEKSFKISASLRVPPETELVNTADARLDAEVRIETTTAFDSVPITLPASKPDTLLESAPTSVRVVVRGPDDLIDALKPSDFVIRTMQYTTPRPGETAQARVAAFFDENVAKSIAEAVTIVSVKPETIKVTCKESNPRPQRRPTPTPQQDDTITTVTEGGFSFLVPVTPTSETLHP